MAFQKYIVKEKKKKKKERKKKKPQIPKIIKKYIGTKLITNTKKQKFKISFRRQWATFLGA